MFWTTPLSLPGAFRLPLAHFPEETHKWKKILIDEKVQGVIDKWTKKVAAEFYEAIHEGIKKLICRLTTCIQRDSDYVEK